MKTRVLLATLCDQRQMIDDCIHRATYKLFATGAGLEISYRHTSRHCSPWTMPEQRKARIERKTVMASESLSHMLTSLRDESLPISPCPPMGDIYPPDMSLKFGEGFAAVSFAWNFGNPPREWKSLDELANAIASEVLNSRTEP